MKKFRYQISPEITVQNLVQKWPQVIPVFLEFKMACVGCDMSCFETLEEAIRIYAVDPEALMDRLEKAINQAPPSD